MLFEGRRNMNFSGNMLFLVQLPLHKIAAVIRRNEGRGTPSPHHKVMGSRRRTQS
jgi:hypothetical protein